MSDGQTTTTTVPPAATTVAARTRGPTVRQFTIIVVILGAAILATTLTSDVTRLSEAGVRLVDGRPYLPARVGDWVGGPMSGLTEDERRLLPADTQGARRKYIDKNGDTLFCSIVLAGIDVTSIHRPELCLPGQGWRIDREFTEPVAIDSAPGGELRVMRINATRSFPLADGRTMQLHSVFAYWFVGKNRVTPYHWQRILWSTVDRVFHNHNHRWAYFLLQAPLDQQRAMHEPEAAGEQAMQIAKQFIKDIYPSSVAEQEQPKEQD